MYKRITIIGAGTAGTMMAHKLSSVLPEDEWKLTIVDRDNAHLYQPGLLFLPFGMYRSDEIVRERKALIPPHVDMILSPIEVIESEQNRIVFKDGRKLSHDILIIATGTRIAPELTEGLKGKGWHENAFDFYTLEGASALGKYLSNFKGGRMIVNIADMPIKCPVAPLEFAFLADWYFTEAKIRDKVEIVFATPLDGAFTKPVASKLLGNLLESRSIKVESNFVVSKVKGEEKVIESYDGRQLDYDCLVSVPLHQGSALIQNSGLGDDDGFVPTDKHTLQSKAKKNIFVLGDATDLPTSKAGSVAHFQAEVLTENILRFIEGLDPKPDFDGHANCFIETGFGKAMLLDFNYKTEPLPGRYPLPGIGPFALLEETHINHWGKLGFRWVYWNLLIKGQELPIDHRMLMAGKREVA